MSSPETWNEDWRDCFREYEPRVDLTSHLHPKQLAFRLDPSFFRAVHGTRRSGKTEGLCVEAVEVADMFPGETVPWILPTIGMGRDIVFPKMEELGQKFDLGLKINRGDFKIHTPSGGVIQLFGLSTKPEAEKGRGKRYPLVIVDEGGAHNQDLLKLAVTQTFGPATADFRGLGGRGIVVAGTAGYEPDSYFEQLVGGNSHVSKLGASVHFMRIWDNPFFRGREQMIIDAYLRENNLPANDAGFRREWLGEFCSDTEGLCYQRWNGALLPRHMIPVGGYTVMGLDLGRHHPCAWVIVRFVVVETVIGNTLRSVHHGHVIASFEKSECGLEEIASITRKLTQAYHVSHIAGDSAGLGATIIDDLKTVYGLPIVAVKKRGDKSGRIWMMDSQLGAGTLHVHEGCDSFARQLRTVPWDDKRKDHHPRFSDHSCFVAGTLVKTSTGDKPIESIKAGDLVHTRKGLRPVELSGALPATEVFEVDFSDGTRLVGTGNHPIWRRSHGWTRLDALRYGDRVEAWPKAKPSCSAASSSDDTQRAKGRSSLGTSRRTELCSRRASGACIKKSGSVTTVRSRKTTRSTTRTATTSTTQSATSNAFPGSGIATTTGQKLAPTSSEPRSTEQSRRRRSGTVRRKAEHGTGNTRGQCNVCLRTGHAQSAASIISDGSPERTASLSARRHASKKRFVRVVALRVSTSEQVVHNLSVRDVHEYYANGILVSNCDAAHYALTLSRQHDLEEQLPPEPGSPEWYKMQEERDERLTLEYSQSRKRAA